MQLEAIEALARPGRRKPLYVPHASHAVLLARDEIERLLPHRDPFLFVDQIFAVDLAEPSIACRRHIDRDDPIFVGHFPDHPVYPGVLSLETMGQAALALLALKNRPRAARGLKIHHTVFLSEVRPGDDLVVLARVLEDDDFTGTCAGQIVRGDEVCCFGIMEVYFVDA